MLYLKREIICFTSSHPPLPCSDATYCNQTQTPDAQPHASLYGPLHTHPRHFRARALPSVRAAVSCVRETAHSTQHTAHSTQHTAQHTHLSLLRAHKPHPCTHHHSWPRSLPAPSRVGGTGPNTSASLGEAHINTIIAATRDDGDAKEYLRRDCVVSAVAVSFVLLCCCVYWRAQLSCSPCMSACTPCCFSAGSLAMAAWVGSGVSGRWSVRQWSVRQWSVVRVRVRGQGQGQGSGSR